LVGRDHNKLARIRDDLQVRFESSRVVVESFEIASTDRIIHGALDLLRQYPPDIIFVAHGWLPDQKCCENDLSLTARALEINGTSACLWLEAAAQYFEGVGVGQIIVIGSVAGDRGRQSNYIYGAAKALIDCYVEGLQHRFFGSSISITLAKPGPTDTPMAAPFKDKGLNLAPVARVGRDIYLAAEARKPVVYTPWVWQLIMAVIRHLPRFVMHRTRL
jgi:short-subunit dehydrogenase